MPWEVVASGLSALTFSDTTLTLSTTYEYRVRADSTDSASAWSNTVSATTPAVPGVIEPQPAIGIPPLTPDEAFAAGHRVLARVNVWENGTRINENALPVGGGRVEIDSGADHIGSVNITIVDETGELLPLRSRDLLSPYGHELAVYRGAIVADEARYWPLGIYRIDDSSWEWDENGIDIHVEGVDRSVAVSDAKPGHIIQFKPGTNFGTAIAQLIRLGLPNVVLNFASVTDTVQELLVYEDGSDLWEAAQSMAKMIGYEVFFDMSGVCVLRPIPETTNDAQPVATYRDGEGGNLVTLGGSMNTRPGYNRFIVTSAGLSDKPVRWMSDDNNPDSPTYVHGPYGVRTLKVMDEKVGTTAQARAAARGMVARKLGGTELTTISSWVDPRRTHGEVLRVRAQGVDYDRMTTSQRLTVPLEHNGRMTITSKARYTIVEERS